MVTPSSLLASHEMCNLGDEGVVSDVCPFVCHGKKQFEATFL